MESEIREIIKFQRKVIFQSVTILCLDLLHMAFAALLAYRLLFGGPIPDVAVFMAVVVLALTLYRLTVITVGLRSVYGPAGLLSQAEGARRMLEMVAAENSATAATAMNFTTIPPKGGTE